MALTNAELLALLERSPEKPQPIIQLQPGQDGVGIESIREEEGEVVVVFTDEREERFPLPVPKDGEKGEPGAQGPKGERGATGKEGPRGVIGLQGVQGPSGEDGFDGRDGRSLASAAIGKSGRLFLTFSDGEIVDAGKVTADQGIPGEAGRNGTAGTKILSGQGAPKSGVGEVGDYYIDFASEDVAFYGPKTKKGWGNPSTRLRQKLPKNAMMAAGGGGSGGSGGGVASVSVTAPIVNAGTAKDLILELATIEGGTY